MTKTSLNTSGHKCLGCGETYRKQDFDVCPFCGGNGGGVTPKVWRPTKHQKKEFIKKISNQNNN